MWIKAIILFSLVAILLASEERPKKKDEARGKRNLEYSISHTYPYNNFRTDRRISNGPAPRYQQFFPGRTYSYHRKSKPPAIPPPYAVQMEPLVQYSQRDPLYDPSTFSLLPQPHNELSKPDDLLTDNNHLSESFYGPPKQYIERPVYIKEPEPIIEIIIKEANTTAAPPPPPALPTKKKKEEVQVFYVKYKKNPHGTGKDSISYDKPVPALSPIQDEPVHDEDEVAPIESYGAPEIEPTYAPPATTTIRAIIKPDSETYHADTGIHVTFGGSKHNPHAEKYLHDDDIVESAPHPAISLPQARRFPEPANQFQTVTQEYRPEVRVPQPYRPFNFNPPPQQQSQQPPQQQQQQQQPERYRQSFPPPPPNRPQTRPALPQFAAGNFNQQPQQSQQQQRPYQFEQKLPQSFQFPRQQTHFPVQQQPPVSQPPVVFNQFQTGNRQQQQQQFGQQQFQQQQQQQQNHFGQQHRPQQNHQQNQQQEQVIQNHNNHHQQTQQPHIPQHHQNQQQHNQQHQHIQQNQQTQHQHIQQPQVQNHNIQHHRQPINEQHQSQQQQYQNQNQQFHQREQQSQHQQTHNNHHQNHNHQQQSQFNHINQQQSIRNQPKPQVHHHPYQPHAQALTQPQPQPQSEQPENQNTRPNYQNDFRQHQFDLNNLQQHVIPPGGELIAALPKFEQHISIPSEGRPAEHLSPDQFSQQIQQQFRSGEPPSNHPPAHSYQEISTPTIRPPTQQQPQTTRQPFIYQTTQQPTTRPPFIYTTQRTTTSKPFYYTTTTHPTTTTTTTSKPESTTPLDLKSLNIQLPDEVPDDLREQLLSSGILKNAQISVLDYDKVGDIPLSALPPDQLANFYGAGGASQLAAAGSEQVPSVVKPDGTPVDQDGEGSEQNEVKVKPPVEMKVVHYDPQTDQGKKLRDAYVKEDAKQVEPVVLNDQTYNRYLPLKVSGAQFPIPDVAELKGKNVNSVVVLAPIDYNFTRVTREASQVDDEIKFVRNEALKDLIRSPTRENYKRFLERENQTASAMQSVILLVTGSQTDREIFMYDVASKTVSKLDGELSTAFVNAAETNTKEDIADAAAAASNLVETKVPLPAGVHFDSISDEIELEPEASELYESRVPIIDPMQGDLEAAGSEQLESFVDISGDDLTPAASDDVHSKTEH